MVVRGIGAVPNFPVGSNMFLLVTAVIWEFAETFHKNHRALTHIHTQAQLTTCC